MNSELHEKEYPFTGLGQPAQRALAGAGITSLAQLSSLREVEVAHLHGIGPNALGKLRQALVEHGLAFKPVEEK